MSSPGSVGEGLDDADEDDDDDEEGEEEEEEGDTTTTDTDDFRSPPVSPLKVERGRPPSPLALRPPALSSRYVQEATLRFKVSFGV